MAAAPCKECGRRPKITGRHRCATCQLRHAPIGEQVEAARARLAMVPPELRRKRTKTIQAHAPSGTAWCAACQSFRDHEDFGKNATTCRACSSAKTHAAMIEKTYGLSGDQYDALLKLQNGRCAICGNRPRGTRLAVEHDHATGAVRGLACASCNHELLGAAWDSLAKITAAWHYLNTPPASGAWMPLDQQPQLAPVEAAVRPSNASGDDLGIVTQISAKRPRAANVAPAAAECVLPHVAPIGSEAVVGRPGLWRLYIEDGAPPPY